jgi:Raf kinase inhibitor-like YbhB/YbcL family protein
MRSEAPFITALAALAVAPVVACAEGGNVPASPAGVVRESITVTSRSFGGGSQIPIPCTCDGEDSAPDVTWSSPPEKTQSLVITLDDMEGGNGAGDAGTHWVVFDIQPEARELHAGEEPAKVGGKLGRTEKGTGGYHGPCPPRHQGHHYALRVFALDRALGLAESADREALNAAMSGHVLGAGELIGTVIR